MKKSPTPDAKNVALATIGVFENDNVKSPIEVHFNPVSLQLTVSNELKDKGNPKKKQQYIAKTTTKLTMDLIFDTTSTGADVTITTRQIQNLVAPQAAPGKSAPKEPPPPMVQFEWGTIKFRGTAEGYKETLDFFSANGVPLRSSINLTLSRMDRIFDEASKEASKAADDVNASENFFDTPAQSAAEASNNAAAPGAAREIAASNGQESLRFGSGAGMTVGGSVQLKPAVAFSSGAGAGLSLGGGAGVGIEGGAGLSLGGGAGVGIGGGAGLSLGGGAGFGVSAGAGIGIGGSGGLEASAGIAGLARLSATEGAFSGLRISTSAPTSARFDPSSLAPKISSVTAATDAGATFQVGGKASVQGSGGLRADVGATGKLSFDAS